MNNFVKIAVFSLAVIGAYTLFSAKYVPEMKVEAPPKEEALDATTMSAEDLAAFGEKVFNGKGACTLCHNPVGGRAPLLDSIAVAASERIKAPDYKGQAKDAFEYIRESMTNPSAYVVKGYGVKGTKDTVSPMPDVRSGEIGLNDTEIEAVIAYLKSLAGVEATAGSSSETAGTKTAR